ncbi:MAG: flagellar hook-basal body complex protein FliE [Rhodospirillales bacterium]|jgi:flagellar hook-basal body complex protein FliE|nr:flagellar hook-basal body complex protein FliE [Rhodospirillales bacterium]
MTAIPTITVTPQAAARAYGEIASGTGGAAGTGFGATLQRAITGAVADGQAADQQAMGAIAGQGNLTDVVTAVDRAELTLQTATAIRDRFVQAYQDVMQMPI